MAPLKVRDVLKLAEEGSGSSRPPKVCKQQCAVLRADLGRLARFLRGFQLSKEEGHHMVWEEAASVIRRALQLLSACAAEEGWIARCLLCEDSRGDFQSVQSDIYECAKLISGFLSATSLRGSEVSEAYTSCFSDRSSLKEAAVEDRRQLFSMASAEEEAMRINKKEQQLLLCSMLVQTMLREEGSSAPEIDHKQIKLKKHIGSGNMGTISEATWLGSNFAVKIFHKGDTSFPRELAALSSHKHANILRIVGHAYYPKEQRHCLVMERMEMDLENLLTKKKQKQLRHGDSSSLCPLPLLASISVMLQVAQAMAWLHSRMVIHRDLKPQNILLNRLGSKSDEHCCYQVKLADFGLARTNFVTSQVSYATYKRGTKIYTAPEVWNADPERGKYSKKSDVYSYAIICYQLLTGRAPYDAETLESSDFMLRVSDGLRPTGEFPSSCPPELVELTRLCWSGDPEDRPQFSEICSQLKLLKSKIITGVHDFTEIRRDLVGSSSSCFGESRTSGSRTSSRPKQKQQGNGKHSSNSGSQGSSGVHSSPSNSYPATQAPQPALDPQAKAREELTVLIRKGKINEAFSYTLSLNDPATVWWLCSKMEPTLLHAFSQTMVMQIAEQVNEDLDVDTNEKISWIAQAVEILMADYKAWGSPRLERFFQRLCENLHGQFALTPRQTEQAEFLWTQLEGATVWLKRVQTAISNANMLSMR